MPWELRRAFATIRFSVPIGDGETPRLQAKRRSPKSPEGVTGNLKVKRELVCDVGLASRPK